LNREQNLLEEAAIVQANARFVRRGEPKPGRRMLCGDSMG
jgi:hypothetical protein